jgi:hypothetical protein
MAGPKGTGHQAKKRPVGYRSVRNKMIADGTSIITAENWREKFHQISKTLRRLTCLNPETICEALSHLVDQVPR